MEDPRADATLSDVTLSDATLRDGTLPAQTARFGVTRSITARHIGTAIAAVLLLIASRLPLSQSGMGSALPSIRVAALMSDAGPSTLGVASKVLLGALASGLVLGLLVMFTSRMAQVLWWSITCLILVASTAVLILMRGNVGPAIALILTAALVCTASGAADVMILRRRRLGATEQ